MTFRFLGCNVVFDEDGVIKHSTNSISCSMRAAIASAFFLIRVLNAFLWGCLTLSQTIVPALVCVAADEVDAFSA
jgi:hypothetical protein